MRKCIYAFTPIGAASLPPYFNFSDTGDGEHAELTVRDHAQMVQHENGSYYDAGHHTTIAVHRDELVKLACSILDWAGTRGAPRSKRPQVDVQEYIASYGTDCTCGARRTPQHNIGCPLRTEQTVGLCVPNAAGLKEPVHDFDSTFSAASLMEEKFPGAFRSSGASGCLAGMEIIGDGPRSP
jgi:hypothetical protein